MANTFQELKKRLDRYVDDVVDTDYAITLFNAAGEAISPYARYAKTATATFDPDADFVSLPTDWMETVELKLKLPENRDYIRLLPMSLVNPGDLFDHNVVRTGIIGYEQFGNAIEVRPKPQSNGTLLIRYYAALPTIDSLDDMPAIPIQFHDLYPLFGAAKWFQEYQDELSTKRDYWDEFNTMLARLDQYTSEQKAKTKSRQVYRFRGWY